MEATFSNIKMHHATRAKAERLIAMLAAEYPRLTLEAVPGEEIDHETYTNSLFGFEVVLDGETPVLESAQVPELADILDACGEMEVDPSTPEGEEDEEPKGSASVVPEKYRQQYRTASSTGQSCGDWLAEQLAGDTIDADGKLNVEDLIAVFEANGLDLNASWAVNRSRGWQGRFRMTGRNILEKQVALAGFYCLPGNRVIDAPAEWLATMEAKHGKWLAKQRKLQAATETSIKEAVEGEAQE